MVQWQGFGFINQTLLVQIRLEQLLVIQSIIKFLSFFRESIRNSMLFNNCKRLFSFGKLVLFQTGASFFFISRLGLESLLGRLNRQSYGIMRAIKTKLAAMPHFQSWAVRSSLKKYQKFFYFYAQGWKVHYGFLFSRKLEAIFLKE